MSEHIDADGELNRAWREFVLGIDARLESLRFRIHDAQQRSAKCKDALIEGSKEAVYWESSMVQVIVADIQFTADGIWKDMDGFYLEHVHGGVRP